MRNLDFADLAYLPKKVLKFRSGIEVVVSGDGSWIYMIRTDSTGLKVKSWIPAHTSQDCMLEELDSIIELYNDSDVFEMNYSPTSDGHMFCEISRAQET